MTTSLTPVWTDNVTVVAPYCLPNANYYRSTSGLDLRTKFGGVLHLSIASGGGTALTAGSALNAKVYRLLNNDGATPLGAYLYAQLSQTTVGKALVNNAGNYASGVVSIAYDGATGTAFAAENTLCFWGVTAIPGQGAIGSGTTEWLNLSKGATTPILLNCPTKYAHNDNEIITIGTSAQIWLEGGSTYAVVFDHLLDAAGEAMACAAYLQSYDSNLAT